jgi:hypothetical protein
VKTIFFCGVHGLPLRGHRENVGLDLDSTENNGIFKGLLQFRVDAGDILLANHLENMTARTMYFSNRIQNELIDVIRLLIQEKLAYQIQKANFFSILADETTDISTCEQLALVIRYVHENIIREDFLTFIQVTDLKGESLSRTILDLISHFQFPLSKLRGQGYDGAAAMSGCYEGVQAHISRLAPLALYTHCSSHCLNLAVCKACSIPTIRNMLGIVSQIHGFFSASALRTQRLKEVILQMNPNSQTNGILGLCETRWVERHEAVLRIREHIHPVYRTLCLLAENGDTNAEVLKNSFAFSDFIIGLTCTLLTTSIFKNLSSCLQKPEIDLVAACEIVTDTLTVLKEKRTKADEVYKTAFKEAQGKLAGLKIKSQQLYTHIYIFPL